MDLFQNHPEYPEKTANVVDIKLLAIPAVPYVIPRLANILLIDRIKSLKKEQSTNVNILVDKNELDRIKTLLRTEQCANILVANKNHELNRENDTLHKELDVVKSLLKTEQSITKSYLEENEKIKKDNNDIIEKLGIINQKFQAIKKIIYKK
jgi:hypothetical protein